MPKVKISATVDPDRLEKAKQLTGCENVSEVLDRGLMALIESYLETVHAYGYERHPQGAETVAPVDPAVWADLPWDE
jgi:hypothetical protein